MWGNIEQDWGCTVRYITIMEKVGCCKWCSNPDLLILTDNTSFRACEMTFGCTKYWSLRYIITHNIISINQKTESLVYSWLCAKSAFLHLSQHQASFQTFCRYFYYLTSHSVQRAMFLSCCHANGGCCWRVLCISLITVMSVTIAGVWWGEGSRHIVYRRLQCLHLRLWTDRQWENIHHGGMSLIYKPSLLSTFRKPH